jgi:hypothetical protein
MIALSNRVHLFARPNTKERLVEFFSDTLGCGPATAFDLPGDMMPVLVFRFPNGASLSVEFTEEAPEEAPLHRGAWLELVTDDSSELKNRILGAGLPRVEYHGSDFFYFKAPGGQVMRIASAQEM